MSSKSLLALFVILWAWLLAVPVTYDAGPETGRPALTLLQGTPVPPHTPQPTPTIDRLAAPPTVENPTQADEGAQLFWLHCQPCHGDQGQGLTEEWRAQYPPEDQNCWESGCHGRRPYENGFTLPTSVPAVTGEDSLERFETMEQVYSFIVAAMPYQNPGHLSEEEYLAITAFLARAHDLWDGTSLNIDNIGSFRLRSPAASETADPSVPQPTQVENAGNDETNMVHEDGSQEFNTFIIGIAAGVIGSLAIIAIILKRRVLN